MLTTQAFFQQILNQANRANLRVGLQLSGTMEWQNSMATQLTNIVNSRVVRLGGHTADGQEEHYAFNKGHQLLGQEISALILDLSLGLDSNSFSSALGALKGGGVLLVVGSLCQQTYADKWLTRAFNQLPMVAQDKPFPEIILDKPVFMDDKFEQQRQSIEKIEKVITGHRKRPLVLTANRGRGKTSALGIASAHLLMERGLKILVTAPSLASVEPLFRHAKEHLPDKAIIKRGRIELGKGWVQFVAPDELTRERPECDLLLVDEAAAIPLPLLITMVSHYHRAVFSTTVHGYEGCGRGFTLKFQRWLDKHRPGWQKCHLTQPIRWAEHDPVEAWHYQTYLLNAELETPTELSDKSTVLSLQSTQTLYEQPERLASCFALLVNAHYQTSPNDLMLILSDPNICLYASFSQDICIGCVLTVDEGKMSPELVKGVLEGSRRPKGQMVASALAVHLAIPEAAKAHSIRIMRIAVHPEYQGKKIGTSLVEQLKAMHQGVTLTTSFGATSELILFWLHNKFKCVRLGLNRDQASGCHSAILIYSQQPWLEEASQLFQASLPYLYATAFKSLPTNLVKTLPIESWDQPLPSQAKALLEHYLNGSTNYETVAPFLFRLLLQHESDLNRVSDLVIRRLIQQWTWQECAIELALPGRKHVEARFKQEIEKILP